MLKFFALLMLHAASIYFLWLLWSSKNKAAKRGGVLTKMGYISKNKSPRLFQFSIWVDFLVLAVLYAILLVYSFWLMFQ